MSTVSRLLLLDTNIVIHLVRGSSVGRRVDARFQLRTRPERPLISVVTLGEALAFAMYRNWGHERVSRLKELLRECVPINITTEPVIERYAEIHTFLTRSGRKLSDNDMWIAACAAAAPATLLSTDKDFDPVAGAYVDRVWIDQQQQSDI